MALKDNNKNENKDKVQWNLLPWESTEEVVKVLMHGNNRPGRKANDWESKGVEYTEECFSAALRHLTAWKKGNKLDKDSELHSLAHAIARLYIIMEIEKYENNKKI